MAASTIHFYFFISFFAAFHSFGGREAGKGGEGGKGGTERGRKAPSSATLRRHPQAPPHGAVIVLSRWYHPLAGSCRHFVIVLLIVVWRGGSAAISRRPGATPQNPTPSLSQSQRRFGASPWPQDRSSVLKAQPTWPLMPDDPKSYQRHISHFFSWLWGWESTS